jgi:hypothetical protein
MQQIVVLKLGPLGCMLSIASLTEQNLYLIGNGSHMTNEPFPHEQLDSCTLWLTYWVWCGQELL